MSREFLHIWMMPWAKWPDDTAFGDMQVWDLHKELNSRLSDPEESEWLRKLALQFVDRNGRPTEDIAILQFGPVPFDRLNGEQNDKVRWAANAICFCFMVGAIFNREENQSFDIGNTERFDLKDLVVDYEGYVHFSEHGDGAICSLDPSITILREPAQNVWKIDVPDRLLLNGLALINDTKQGSKLWRQLEVCFQWFKIGWSKSRDVSEQMRIISLMTAFESLAGKKENNDLYKMVKAANRLCNWKKLPRTESMDNGQKSIPSNKPSRFILDYAIIRNFLVHGSNLNLGQVRHVVEDSHNEPRVVMTMVLYGMVIGYLKKAGVWSDTIELAIMERKLKDITQMFLWDTDKTISPSPHLRADS